LTPDDVETVLYPDYGQGAGLAQDQVDAATGFANNEPVAMQLAGTEVNVIHVDDVIALPGPGLVAGRETLAKKPAAIRAFIAATLRAMREIAEEPGVGLDAAIAAVPELASARDAQAAILAATIEVWAPAGGGPDDYGRIDGAGWEASVAYMTELDLVPNPVTADQLYDARYLPAE
jgi:NitT/TauT family transport system substrate-binding protein